MTTICINQVALEYVGGGSDKLYIIQVQEEVLPGTGTIEYRCVGYYGRRGASLSEATKYRGPCKASARAAADKLEREKRGKGYGTMSVSSGARITGMPASAPVFGGASVPSAAAAAKPAKARVGVLPMLAVTATESAVQDMLAHPDYVTQSKYDGERVVVSLRRSGIVATNRKGEERPLTAPVLEALTKVLALPDFGDERETVLDGELMGDVYVAYDLITLRDNDVRKQSFEERFANLEELLIGHAHLLAPTAWTEAEKREMLAEAERLEWEGVMFRKVTGGYASGRSNDLIKHKLWATATCRVLTANAKRSIQVALRDENDTEVFVGNVTVPANQEVPELDSLVEVRYLYALEGGSLYQPTLLGVRNDLDEADRRADLRQAPPEKRGTAEFAEAMI